MAVGPPREHATIREVLVDLYTSVPLALARGAVAAWRSAGARPGRLALALARTVVAIPVALLYVGLATVVPLTVGFLFTITAPIIVVAEAQWLWGRSARRRGLHAAP